MGKEKITEIHMEGTAFEMQQGVRIVESLIGITDKGSEESKSITGEVHISDNDGSESRNTRRNTDTSRGNHISDRYTSRSQPSQNLLTQPQPTDNIMNENSTSLSNASAKPAESQLQFKVVQINDEERQNETVYTLGLAAKEELKEIRTIATDYSEKTRGVKSTISTIPINLHKALDHVVEDNRGLQHKFPMHAYHDSKPHTRYACIS